MYIQSIMKKATAAVELMYDKTATVKRQMPIVKETGADGTDWFPIHESVPCRLSNSGLNNASQKEVNVIQYDVKLFLSSKYDVKAGDIVIVNGVEYESAKEPFVYVSHQEVLLVRKGYA